MRYTIASIKDLIQHLTQDVVAVLINAPIYGGTNPNLSQLTALDAITMQDIVRYELQGNYKRFIYPTITKEEVIVGQQTIVQLTAPIRFECAITNATHICYIYNALTSGANDANYNNRGSAQGIPLLIKPISDNPITLVPPATLEHTFMVKLGNQ